MGSTTASGSATTCTAAYAMRVRGGGCATIECRGTRLGTYGALIIDLVLDAVHANVPSRAAPAFPAKCEVRLLGEFRLIANGSEIRFRAPERALELLAFLLVRRGPVERGHVAEQRKPRATTGSPYSTPSLPN